MFRTVRCSCFVSPEEIGQYNRLLKMSRFILCQQLSYYCREKETKAELVAALGFCLQVCSLKIIPHSMKALQLCDEDAKLHLKAVSLANQLNILHI
jgi:hypothetical protein